MKAIEKICPTCKIEAIGKKQVEKIFGFRMMDKLRVQSYCKTCRSLAKQGKLKKKRVKKKQSKKKVNKK